MNCKKGFSFWMKTRGWTAVWMVVMVLAFANGRLQAQSNKQNMLQDLGFDATTPPPEMSASGNPHGEGTKSINPQYEMFLNHGSGNDARTAATYDNKNLIKQTTLSGSNGPSDIVGVSYVRSFAADFDRTGKKEYLVELSLKSNGSNGLRVNYRHAGSHEPSANPGLVGEIDKFSSTDAITAYGYTSLMAAAVGDFNGDGTDEIAIYNPSSGTIQIWTRGSGVMIYVTGFYIPLLSSPDPIAALKDYYSVSIAAGDLNGDGKDDLAIVVNRHNSFRKSTAADADATIAILHSNSVGNNYSFTVVRSDDFTGNGGEVGRLRFRNSSGDNANTNLLLRSGGVAIGDINGDGVNEVVVSGLFTGTGSFTSYGATGGYLREATAWFTGDGRLGVGSLNSSGYMENAFTVTASNMSDNQTGSRLGPLPIVTFKANGDGSPAHLMSGGKILRWENSAFAVEYSGRNSSNRPTMRSFLDGGSNSTYPRAWYTEAVAGNFNRNPTGREGVAMVVAVGADDGAVKLGAFVHNNTATGPENVMTKTLNNGKQRSNCSLAGIVLNDRSLRVTYSHKSFYFTNPDILAVLQAAPSFGELNYDRGETTLSFSSSSGGSQAHNFSISAGVILGYDLEVSFFGIGKSGYETNNSLTATVGGGFELSHETTFGIDYTSAGDEDRVVLTMVPYTKYHYNMFVPETKMPTQSEYNTAMSRYSSLKSSFNPNSPNALNDAMEMDDLSRLIAATDEFRASGTAWGATIPAKTVPYEVSVPSTPRPRQFMTVDYYDEIARQYGYQTIRGNVLPPQYKWGDPATYRPNTGGLDPDNVMALGSGPGGAWSAASWMGGDGSRITRSIEITNTHSASLTWGISIETEQIIKLAGVKMGISAGIGYDGGYTWSSTDGEGFAGTVTNMPFSATNYAFNWNVFAHRRKVNGANAIVLEYLVQNVTGKTGITPSPLTITAPAPGPASTVVTYTNPGFTAAMTWSPNDDPLLLNGNYTATFTLTAAADYAFRGFTDDKSIAGFTVNGIPPDFVSCDADELVFTVTYPDLGVFAISFPHNPAYDIPDPIVGVDITPITFAPTGGAGGWSIVDAIGLPDGLTFTGLVLSGAPTMAQPAGTVTIIVADVLGNRASVVIAYDEIKALVLPVPLSVYTPVAGEMSSTFIDHNGAGFAAALVWTGSSDPGWVSTTPYVLGDDYTATITLTAATGYTFTGYGGDAAIAGFTVNGNLPEWVSLSNGDTELIFTVDMMALITATNATAPQIDTQPEDATVQVGDPDVTLTIAASSTDGGTISYQWYSLDNANIATLIPSATGSSYTFDMSSTVKGVYMFRVAVTNNNPSATGMTQAMEWSNIVSVNVDEDYFVLFDMNYAGSPAAITVAIAKDATEVGTLMPNNPVRTDYVFTGWNTMADGSGTTFTASSTVTADMTVYAQWVLNTTGATVYAVSIATLADGTITPDKVSFLYEEYETVTLTVSVLTAGYELSSITAYRSDDITEMVAVSQDLTDATKYVFDMPAFNVTVTAVFQKSQATIDLESVADAKALIDAAFFAVDMYTANTATDVTTWLVAEINSLIAATGVTVTASDITQTAFTAAAGMTDGNFDFDVTLTKGAATDVASNTVLISTGPLHTLAFDAFTNGTVTAMKTYYKQAETVTLIITPDAGYDLDVIRAYRTANPAQTVTLSTPVGSPATCTFAMPDAGVTVSATFKLSQASLDLLAVAAAKAAIEGRTYTVAQLLANTENEVKAWLVSQINDLISISTGITVTAADITLSNFTQAGPLGNGGFDFTVALVKGSASDTASMAGNTITSIPSYSITVTATTNGSVAPLVANARAGETVILVISPATNYELNTITAYKTGDPATVVVLNTVDGKFSTFLMPDYDVTVSATFKQSSTVNPPVTPPNPPANPDADAVASAKTAIENHTYTVNMVTAHSQAAVRTWLTAQLNAVIAFTGITLTEANVTINGFTAATTDYDGNYGFSVSLRKGNATATAIRTGNKISSTVYGIIVGAAANGNVSANKQAAGSGEIVTLTIAPSAGYELASITVSRTGTAAITVSVTGNGQSRSFSMPAYDVTVAATFTKTQATLDAETAASTKSAIEGGTYRVAQVTANSQEAVHAWLKSTLNVLFSQSYGLQLRSSSGTPVIGDITITSIIPAIAGTTERPEGVNGLFAYNVALACGASTVTTTNAIGIIVASPHTSTQVKRIELMPFAGLTTIALNSGNVATGTLTLTLSGANANVFTLPSTTLNSLSAGSEASITLTPKANLAAGNYTATLTVSGEGMTSVSAIIIYTVNPTANDVITQSLLQAWTVDGRLHVSGLTAGTLWQVYNLSGNLVYQGVAPTDKAEVTLPERGIYIVVNGKEVVKALN